MLKKLIYDDNTKHVPKHIIIKRKYISGYMLFLFVLVHNIDTPDHSEVYKTKDECDLDNIQKPGYCELSCKTDKPVQ